MPILLDVSNLDCILKISYLYLQIWYLTVSIKFRKYWEMFRTFMGFRFQLISLTLISLIQTRSSYYAYIGNFSFNLKINYFQNYIRLFKMQHFSLIILKRYTGILLHSLQTSELLKKPIYSANLNKDALLCKVNSQITFEKFFFTSFLFFNTTQFFLLTVFMLNYEFIV